mgnify:CR=1 FL=1
MRNEKVKKEIIDRLKRKCVVCGKKMKIILYKDRTYRGGKYWSFGKKINKKKPEFEYWECPKCYRS